jgi:hypothetical protein
MMQLNGSTVPLLARLVAVLAATASVIRTDLLHSLGLAKTSVSAGGIAPIYGNFQSPARATKPDRLSVFHLN